MRSSEASPDGGAAIAEAPAPDPIGHDHCRNHARVPSVGRCEACLAPICQVCDFTWAGGRHFCPVCATAPREHLIAARKRSTAWSLGLAAWNSLGLLVLLGLGVAGEPQGEMEETLLGFTMIFLCVLPGAVGFALALNARSLSGPSGGTSLTLPIVWNAVLLGLWFALMVVGVFQTP